MSAFTPVFTGVVDLAGQLHLDARVAFSAVLKKFRGQHVELVIRKKRQTRSLQANRYWWGVIIPLIAEELGYLPHEHDAVHDAVIRHLVGVRPGSDPRLQIRATTHDMDTEDFGMLIEHAIIWAASDLGIVIPDPHSVESRPVRTCAA